MRMILHSHEENQICLALFHGTGKNVQLGPSEHWASNCPQNGLYRHYWFYSQLQNQEKLFKCFVLRTCNFGFRCHLFLYQKFLCCHFNFKKKYFFLPILRLLHFQKSYMNTKLTFEVGPGPLISPVRQGPCGLNSAMLGDSPKCRIPPVKLSSFLQWRPLLATFRLWI